MKNNREVCSAIHAGYAEYSGLPGKVRTGCPNTPDLKSRYCSVHAPFTAIPHEVQFFADGTPADQDHSTSKKEESQVALITGKRITRNSVFYEVTTTHMNRCMEYATTSEYHAYMYMYLQVVWLGKPMTRSTWEPKSSLPEALVESYEDGLTQEIQREGMASGGQTIYTLSTSLREQPPPKRPRVECADNLSNSSG